MIHVLGRLWSRHKVRFYSQLRNRVPNTIFLFEYSLCSATIATAVCSGDGANILLRLPNIVNIRFETKTFSLFFANIQRVFYENNENAL